MPWGHLDSEGDIVFHDDRPARVTFHGTLVFNPSDDTLLAAGWYPVIEQDPPANWETNPYIHRVVEIYGDPATEIRVRYVRARTAPDG
jgi:hypothetical protein